jgi:hypothetical protein
VRKRYTGLKSVRIGGRSPGRRLRPNHSLGNRREGERHLDTRDARRELGRGYVERLRGPVLGLSRTPRDNDPGHSRSAIGIRLEDFGGGGHTERPAAPPQGLESTASSSHGRRAFICEASPAALLTSPLRPPPRPLTHTPTPTLSLSLSLSVAPVSSAHFAIDDEDDEDDEDPPGSARVDFQILFGSTVEDFPSLPRRNPELISRLLCLRPVVKPYTLERHRVYIVPMSSSVEYFFTPAFPTYRTFVKAVNARARITDTTDPRY